MTELSNEPNDVNLVIIQGSTLSFQVTITEVGTDFTGATVSAKIVNNFAARTTVTALTVSGTSGAMDTLVFTLGLTATQTAALSNTTAGERRQSIGVYDAEVTLADTVTVARYLQGTAILSREATIP